MSKPKFWKRFTRSRDAPNASVAWLCSSNAYDMLVGDGYRPLSRCPEVQMCVHKYADLISSMTIYLMTNTEDGDVRVKNALSDRIDIDPNPLLSRKQLIYTIVRTMLLEGKGNQITYPRMSARGHLDSLDPIPPSQVSILPDDDGYVVRWGGEEFLPDEVLHFAVNPDPEQPWMGQGFHVALRDVANALGQADSTKDALMKSPAPSLIVKVDGLTEEFSSLEGRKKLREQYLDSSENGEPWFIPAEAFSVETVKPMTMMDLAVRENIELDKRKIAGIFSMPPFLVGVGEYKKDEFNNFITTCVMPMAKIIEQEMTRKLLWSHDLYFKFNYRSLYAYDISEIITAGSAMVDRMAMTRNEWRDWIGMGPNDQMKELLALENYVPADMLGKQKKLYVLGADDDAKPT